jgi:hypothetical protein
MLKVEYWLWREFMQIKISNPEYATKKNSTIVMDMIKYYRDNQDKLPIPEIDYDKERTAKSEVERRLTTISLDKATWAEMMKLKFEHLDQKGWRTLGEILYLLMHIWQHNAQAETQTTPPPNQVA